MISVPSSARATTAQELAAILSSAEGCRLLTVHSEWILFAYLPVASVATSIVGRALRMSSWLLLGVVSILALSRIVIMWVAGQVNADLAGVCGFAMSGAGASLLEAIIGFILCVLLAGTVILVRRGPRAATSVSRTAL